MEQFTIRFETNAFEGMGIPDDERVEIVRESLTSTLTNAHVVGVDLAGAETA